MDGEDDITSVGDFEDSGSEYLPSPTPSSGNNDSEEAQQRSTSSTITSLPQPSRTTSGSIPTAEFQLSLSEQVSAETTNETPVLKSKKRVKNKKPETWQRNVLKLKRAKGEEYENHKRKSQKERYSCEDTQNRGMSMSKKV